MSPTNYQFLIHSDPGLYFVTRSKRILSVLHAKWDRKKDGARPFSGLDLGRKKSTVSFGMTFAVDTFCAMASLGQWKFLGLPAMVLTPIDSIWAVVMVVWRLSLSLPIMHITQQWASSCTQRGKIRGYIRGKIIRTSLCCAVHDVHDDKPTHAQMWAVLKSVCRSILGFLCVYCLVNIYVYLCVNSDDFVL